ncbi:dihydrolipoyl dehydrogenase family protein [Desulfobaculum sp.]
MGSYDFDLGIIGGGAAGLTVAAGSAQLGAKTLLIEREPALGGDCLHYGCVPSKTLLHSAHVYHQMRSAHRFGLPSVDVPPVEFYRVAERIREVQAMIQEHDSVERFCGLGARVEFGEAVFVDEHSVRVGGAVYSAGSWVVATGTRPGAPPIPGLDSVDYLTNEQIFSLEELPASLTILGGGPIACEMAQAFSRLGSKVTLIQRSAHILSGEDADMAEVVQQALRDDGVSVHVGTSVREVVSTGHAAEVVFTDAAGAPRSVVGEALFVALGRTPNIEGLGLEQAGVDASRRGIGVDARMRTNVKHIYAAGDVTGQHQFTHAAGYEGGIVVSNAVFHLPRKADYTNLPRCTYTWPESASIGHNEKSAAEAGLDVDVITEDFAGNDRALAEGETRGRIKLLLTKGRPVGVQIVGPHAGELINEWVAIQSGGVKLSTLASAVHPYPTLGEINKRVAGNYLGPKIFSDKVKKTLKLFFNYKGNACTLGAPDAGALAEDDDA